METLLSHSIQIVLGARCLVGGRMASSSKTPEEPRDDDDDDVSFPELLDFASRAQTLICELLLLSDRIPPQFLDRRFDPVLFDLRYFDCPDDFEARIDGNRDLEALEDELRDSCHSFIQRFSILAIGIVSYHQEIVKYLNDVQEGLYLHNTLDKILESELGRQLLTESLTLFGCLLLLMVHLMSGFLREKLLVAYVRHGHCFDEPKLDLLCSLCCAHPSTHGDAQQSHSLIQKSSMILVQRPEDLFARFPFPKVVIDAVICRVRDDDLYICIRHYPDPHHRTVALSAQAGCLYVLLFYSSELLHDDFVMREIVDRFFKDCWVVPVFLYFTVDLYVSWDAYKEAKSALSSYLSPTFVRDRSQLHCIKVKELFSELYLILSNGSITRDYVFENSQHLLALIRTFNVSIRWLLLHRSSIDRKMKDSVVSAASAHQVDDETLMLLLIKTSQIEFEVKQLYAMLLDSKDTLLSESKCRASDCIKEVLQQCSGPWASSYKIKNEGLKDWFGKLALEVNASDYTRVSSCRKLYHAISALKEVEKYHQFEENLLIKQNISQIQKCLLDMVKSLSIDNDMVSTFSVIATCRSLMLSTHGGLLGGILNFYMQRLIKIHQLCSICIVSFLSFNCCWSYPYHGFLKTKVVIFLVSQIIIYPCTWLMFVRCWRSYLYLFSESSMRTAYKVCSHFSFQTVSKKRTFKIIYSWIDNSFWLRRSVRSLTSHRECWPFLGVVVASLTCWLEARMKKELRKLLKNKLKSFFFSSSVQLEELEESVRALTNYLLSQSDMMKCFQDLLHIHGNCIWVDELSDIWKHCAQMERDGFIKRKQDTVATAAQTNDFSSAQTFLGRLLNQMLHLTNPSHSMFIESMSGWFDVEGHELLGLHFFVLLESCLGPVGLVALDSLLTALIVDKLEHAFLGMKNLLNARRMEEISKLDFDLGHAATLPLLGFSLYKKLGNTVDTSWNPLVESLAFVGQMQLLRCFISLKLKTSCKIKSDDISIAVENLTLSVFPEREKIKSMDAKEEMNTRMGFFLPDLNKQRMMCGFFSPLQTIYFSKVAPPFIARCASVASISQLPRYIFDSHLGTLTSRVKTVTLDFSPLVIGLGTFLRQFHSSYITQYVQYMGQYVRTAAETAFGAAYKAQKGSTQQTSEVLKSAYWLMYFCKHMEVPKELLDSVLPPSLLTVLQT